MEGEYYCQRCLKKFPTKYKLKRHFKRKKLCKLNGLDLNYETMLKDLDEKPNFNCKKCSRKFNYENSFKTHICSIKKKNSLSELSDKIKEQKDILQSLLNNKSKETIIRNKVNNTMNIMNQNNINITINDYGKEDISHITNQFVLDIISKMNSSALIKYIKAVHCDNPCNLNIILPNHKQKYVLLWKNNKWVLENKTNILDGMIVKNFDRINDIYEKLENKLPLKIKKEYNNYADTFDKSIRERQLIKNGTINLLVSNNNNKLSIKS